MDIYSCVKETDKKEWNDIMIEMYTKYVQEFSKDLNSKELEGKLQLFQEVKK